MPAPLSIARLRQKLIRQPARRLGDSGQLSHAAVALILRDARPGPELLVIQRAEHPLDPWSGDLGFPGGRMEPRDATPEAAALRETREELGVEPEGLLRRMGALSELRAGAAARLQPLSVFPFVYELAPPGGPAPLPVDFHPNPAEVAAVHWVPLAFFANPANRVARPYPRRAGASLTGYPVGPRILWGLSLAMLEELIF